MRIKQESPIRDPDGLPTGRSNLNGAPKPNAAGGMIRQLNTLGNIAHAPHSNTKSTAQPAALFSSALCALSCTDITPPTVPARYGHPHGVITSYKFESHTPPTLVKGKTQHEQSSRSTLAAMIPYQASSSMLNKLLRNIND